MDGRGVEEKVIANIKIADIKLSKHGFSNNSVSIIEQDSLEMPKKFICAGASLFLVPDVFPGRE